MLKRGELFQDGYSLQRFPLGAEYLRKLKADVLNSDWESVDREFAAMTRPGGVWFDFLRGFHDFSSIETMISIRDAENEWEEDGIWHDDGSRVFAFSLSLTLDPARMEGGCLELRRKGIDGHSTLIPTPEFGTAILFLTGIHGYEHRTRKVEKGKRVILVGWCT